MGGDMINSYLRGPAGPALTGAVVATIVAGLTLAVASLVKHATAQTASDAPAATAVRTLSAVEALATSADRRRIESGQKFFGDATYVGSGSCQSCHATQHKDWAITWHAKMERLPSAETVIADFDNRTIVYKGVRAQTKEGRMEEITFSIVTSKKDGRYYFTILDQDNPTNNQIYEIALVIGGKWDQHYEVKIGDNFFPTPIRWSVAANDWLTPAFRPQYWVMADGTPDGRPRRPEELPKDRFAEAKCSGCHTTGFEFYKDAQAGGWTRRGDGQHGIGCESCHGPASRHVAEAKGAEDRGERVKAGATTIIHPLKDLTPLQQTELCGQCHGRNSNKTAGDLGFQLGFRPGNVDMTTRVRFWSYSGATNPDESSYFYPNDWARRNRQQWQDFTKSKHFTKTGVTCVTCHTLHGKWEAAQLRQAPDALCTGCHTLQGSAKRPNAEMFADSPMAKAGVQCIDCHMSRTAYRSDRTSKGPHQWDVSNHTFMVSMPSSELARGIRSSCSGCHEGAGIKLASGVQSPPMDLAELDMMIRDRQAETRKGIEDVQKLLRAIKSGQPEATRLSNEANDKLSMVLLDGSMGLHNFERAMDLINEARRLADGAGLLR
jgi:predicted CXXCH cytochrome family protein